MDCKTARMLVEFARPGAGELSGADLADLERHLAGCPECEEWCRGERLLDQHLGKAMRQVEVPDRLRPMLRTRLAEACAAASRKRLRRVLSAVAAVAAVVLVGVGIHLWLAAHPPVLDLRPVFDELNNRAITADTTREDLKDYFLKQGLDVEVPLEFNYSLLTNWGMSPLQGKQVPELNFHRSSEKGGECAVVYLLTSKQFDLQSVRKNKPEGLGYKFNVRLIYDEGSPQGFVIFHTGDTPDWLMKKDFGSGTQAQ